MTLRTRLFVALLAVAGGPVVLAAAYIRGAALGAMAVLAVLLALAAAAWLWHTHQRRLAELAQTVSRAADGDLSVRVPVQPGDGTDRLVDSLNRVAYRTRWYGRALAASREQLRHHLTVLGDTLSSTHDLDRMLLLVLRTALVATRAQSGAVLLLDPAAGSLSGHRAELAAPVAEPLTIPLGEGLLGGVAATGEPRRGTTETGGSYLVVPISAPVLPPQRAWYGPSLAPYHHLPHERGRYERGRSERGRQVTGSPWPAPPTVRGVLALYDRLGGDEFDDDDLATLRTFAGQTAVAIDNVHTHQEAQRLSLTDPLTGLWNYRYLKESLHREVERASRYGHTLAVLALDLDRFKEVNDAYGHPAGDEVLIEFARRISRATREVDLAFRHGGEEFVVLLPETDSLGATVLAQRLGNAVRHEPVLISPRELVAPAEPVKITVSIGIAVYPEHALTSQAVLDAADDALYAAKAAGRDTYQVATAAPATTATAELPVRSGARSPAGDLPQAGAGGSAGGGDSTGGGAPAPRQPGNG